MCVLMYCNFPFRLNIKILRLAAHARKIQNTLQSVQLQHVSRASKEKSLFYRFALEDSLATYSHGSDV